MATKKLWGRVGVTLTLTDQQYAALIAAYQNGERDGSNLASVMMLSFLTDRNVTRVDGETYFPEKRVFCATDDYDNPDFEMNFDL